MAIEVIDSHPIGAVLKIERAEGAECTPLAEAPERIYLRAALSLLMVAILVCAWTDWAGRDWKRPPAAPGQPNEISKTNRTRWQLVVAQPGIRGREQFVLVEKQSESDQKLYDDAIAHLCRSDEWCGLHFWSDSSLIPSHLPMSDLQAACEVANYTQNPDTGFTQFVWNCRVHDDPLNCFSY
jgi:hypothetical protein